MQLIMNINNQHDKKQEFGGTRLRVLNKILFMTMYVSCGSGEHTFVWKMMATDLMSSRRVALSGQCMKYPIMIYVCLVVAGVGVCTLSVPRTAAYTSHRAASQLYLEAP